MPNTFQTLKNFSLKLLILIHCIKRNESVFGMLQQLSKTLLSKQLMHDAVLRVHLKCKLGLIGQWIKQNNCLIKQNKVYCKGSDFTLQLTLRQSHLMSLGMASKKNVHNYLRWLLNKYSSLTTLCLCEAIFP